MAKKIKDEAYIHFMVAYRVQRFVSFPSKGEKRAVKAGQTEKGRQTVPEVTHDPGLDGALNSRFDFLLRSRVKRPMCRTSVVGWSVKPMIYRMCVEC